MTGPLKPTPKLRNKKPTRATLLQRDMELWSLRQQGYTTAFIATHLSLSPAVVERRIDELFRTYRAKLTGEVESQVGIIAAQYQYIINESLEAWRNSKTPNKRVSKTNMRRLKADGASEEKTPAGDEMESTNVASNEVEPDSRYLTTAMQAMEKYQKLVGLDAPQQVQISGTDGGAIRIQHELDFSGFDTPRMAAYLQEMAQVALSIGRQAVAALPPDSIIDMDDMPVIIEHEPTIPTPANVATETPPEDQNE